MEIVVTENQKKIATQRQEVKKAQMLQSTQQTVVQMAQNVQNKMDDLAKQATEPIKEVLQLLKKITAKLNEAVDANSDQYMLDDAIDESDDAADEDSTQSLFSEKMGEVKTQAGQIADKVGDISEKALDQLGEQFKNSIMPEDSSIVQDIAGKLLNDTIKTGFEAIKTPIKSIESLVPITQLTKPLNAITTALDGLCKIATTDIPDSQLDTMLSRKLSIDALLQTEKENIVNAKDKLTDTAKNAYEKVKDGVADMYSQAKEKAAEIENNIKASTKGITAGLEGGIKQSWKNFRCPEIPPGIQTTIDDFIKAVMQVCSNIQNVAITVLFKLIEQIFDCLNQILGILGVPEIPDPLGSIPKIAPDVIAIFTFITNLPISLVKLVKAIIKKKIKMMSIMMDCPAAIPPMKIEHEVEAESKGCGGGGGCAGGGDPPPIYKVVFYNEDKIVSEQDVEEGKAASDPGQQTRSNDTPEYGTWKFTGWSEDFSKVMSTMQIYANYEWIDIDNADNNIQVDAF